jgi:hypothetical protein
VTIKVGITGIKGRIAHVGILQLFTHRYVAITVGITGVEGSGIAVCEIAL